MSRHIESEYKYCHIVGNAKVYTKTLEDYYKTRKSLVNEGKSDAAKEIFGDIEKIRLEFLNKKITDSEMVVKLFLLRKKYTEFE